MDVRTLPPSARRSIAALWFATFAGVATALFFLPLAMAAPAIILYIGLPTVAAGIAGFRWGAAILDPSHIQTYGQSVLRGLMIAGWTFVIFAALYACGLPLLEHGWSSTGAGSLFLLTLMLGALMGGPLAAVTGMIAAISLFRLSRHVRILVSR